MANPAAARRLFVNATVISPLTPNAMGQPAELKYLEHNQLRNNPEERCDWRGRTQSAFIQ